MKKLIAIVIVVATTVGLLGAGQLMLLEPTEPGVKSKMVPVEKTLNISKDIEYNYVLKHDNIDELGTRYYCPLDAGDTMLIWFEPPVKCSLVAILVGPWYYGGAGAEGTSYEAFASEVASGVTFPDDWTSFRAADATPGPSPIGEWLLAPIISTTPAAMEWDEPLEVTGHPDIGERPFLGGFVYPIDKISILASVVPSGDISHTLIYGAPSWYPGLTRGWYWHNYGQFGIRALVSAYENLGPQIAMKKLPDTYITSNRQVTADIFDPLGVPVSLHGIEFAKIYYSINEGSETELDMEIVDGDSTDGTWAATIPGIGVDDAVDYYIIAQDYNGAADTTASHSYTIRAGTAGNMLLLLEDDEYYGQVHEHRYYSYDPLTSIGADFDVWDEYAYGKADSSVLEFHHTGPGAKTIFWISWSGYSFANNVGFLSDFLDDGGNLFVSSEDLPCGGFELNPHYEDWIAPDGHFLKNYLKANAGYDDYYNYRNEAVDETTFVAFGVPGDPISGSTELEEIAVFPYGLIITEPDTIGVRAAGRNYAGKFTELGAGAEPIFYDSRGEFMGYRYEDTEKGYRLVFFYWPFQFICEPDRSAWDFGAMDALTSNLVGWLVGVEEEPGLGTPYMLSQVSPNPLSRPTTINFSIRNNEHVSVKVYDITGSLVDKLVDKNLTAGTHTLTINTDKLASGVYFLKMDAGTFSGTRKFIVMK